jgi:hypothetical protein
MRAIAPRRIIVRTMSSEPVPQLSPELVLILPPEVAAIARMTLPEPAFASPAGARRSGRRAFSRRRAAELAALYTLALALTLTPLGLVMKAVPGHRASHPLRVDHDLRSQRNDPH